MRYIVVNLSSTFVLSAPGTLYLVVDTADSSATQVVACCQVEGKAQQIAAALNAS